jgi:hypothetical protein
MVPAFAREQNGFEVERVANEKRDSKKRTPSVSSGLFTENDAVTQVRATCAALAKLEANARRPNNGLGCEGKVFLDLASHSRRT